MRSLLGFSLFFMIGINLTGQDTNGSGWKYPNSKTVDQVDNYFGTEIADPYRWLENDVRVDKEVEKWVADQNELTFGYLKTLPFREEIEARITKLWNYEKYGLPRKAGNKYY